MSPAIKAISDSGIPVIGHIGLTLQRGLDVSDRGDGNEDADAGILAGATSVQDAGADALDRSGPSCTGQMVLQSEVLGFQTPLLLE